MSTTTADSRQKHLAALAAIHDDAATIAANLTHAIEQTWEIAEAAARDIVERLATHAEAVDEATRFNAQLPADSAERLIIRNPGDVIGEALPPDLRRLLNLAARGGTRPVVEELAHSAVRAHA
ncbi:hypothetical protein [Streptomyces sp. NPDC088736]|uniref:hypothetical protein n=1 Tax=Streptomyces sp. NPDC088736 TaxID=3365881 RepID=UPI00382AD43D